MGILQHLASTVEGQRRYRRVAIKPIGIQTLSCCQLHETFGKGIPRARLGRLLMPSLNRQQTCTTPQATATFKLRTYVQSYFSSKLLIGCVSRHFAGLCRLCWSEGLTATRQTQPETHRCTTSLKVRACLKLQGQQCLQQLSVAKLVTSCWY